jgi:uncharacterized protein YecE (DUF72 family)
MNGGNTLLIGTSGYDYPEWRGVFYPATLSRKDFLPYYATKFNALELNFSFYRMPTAGQLSEMAGRSENKIMFSVKAHQSFTHQQIESTTGSGTPFPIANWRDGALEFSRALEPLAKDNVLASVLFQFPQSFHYTVCNRKYLSDLLAYFNQFPLAVELRHAEWQNDRVREGLAARNTSLVFCDEPTVGAIPATDISRLNDLDAQSYIRFHGRNAAAWYSRTSAGTQPQDRSGTVALLGTAPSTSRNGSARYDYLYSAKELSDYLPAIHNKIEKGLKVQIYFNNHPKGAAAKNALELKKMISST